MRTVRAEGSLALDTTVFADTSEKSNSLWLKIVGEKSPCDGCAFYQHCRSREHSCESFNHFVKKGEIDDSLPRIPKRKHYTKVFPPDMVQCQLAECDKHFHKQNRRGQERKYCSREHMKLASERRRLQQQIGTEETCRECYAEFIKTGPEQQLCFLCRYTSHFHNGSRNLGIEAA